MTGYRAVLLARRGWYVFPCLPDDKRPAVDRWEQRASASPEHVEDAWQDRYPGHNAGIACGPSGLVVLDLDTHGTLPDDWRLPGIRDGRDVLAQLCEWAGQPWPSTYWVATPSGGWHLYFRAPEGPEIRNSAGKIGPMIDVRGAGGYVVGAGSVGGKPYEVLDGQSPAPLPRWIARMLTRQPEPVRGRAAPAADPPRRLRGLADTVRNSKPGDRTGPLVWAAHRLGEMIAAGEADASSAEQLVQAAVDAGIDGGEPYARRQVRHVLGGSR